MRDQIFDPDPDPRIRQPNFTTVCCKMTYADIRWKPDMIVRCHCGQTTWCRTDSILMGMIEKNPDEK